MAAPVQTGDLLSPTLNAQRAAHALRLACSEFKVDADDVLRADRTGGRITSARSAALYLAVVMGGVAQRNAGPMIGLGDRAGAKAVAVVRPWFDSPKALMRLRRLEAQYSKYIGAQCAGRQRHALSDTDIAHGTLIMRSRGISDEKIARRMNIAHPRALKAILRVAGARGGDRLPPTQETLDRLADISRETWHGKDERSER